MLEQYLPIFQKTIIALEQIQADKEKAPDIAKNSHKILFLMVMNY